MDSCWLIISFCYYRGDQLLVQNNGPPLGNVTRCNNLEICAIKKYSSELDYMTFHFCLS